MSGSASTDGGGGAAEHRVLVIDDDPDIRALVPALLRPLGCETRAVDRPSTFFAEVEAWRPTHILLDLIMPGMDGVEVLAELGRRRCRAAVIVTSGLGARVLGAAERTAVNHGLAIVGVLEKPFRTSALRELVSMPPPFDSDGAAPAPRDDHAEVVDVEQLRRAVRGRELTLALQPQIRLDDGWVTGFEALVRWDDGVNGPVRPDLFVPVAESTGLIGELTEVVLDLSLDWYAAHIDRTQGQEHPVLAINVSGLCLDDRAFVDRLGKRCAVTGIDPGCIVVEITETTAMSDPEVALEMLTRLRVQGFQIALDDFGTGFSSMTALADLPFSELKVDRSFVTGMLDSKDALAVVSTAIDLGHRLGLRVTAEGVEDLATLERLQDMECDQAQGFFIARPMSPDDAATWLDQRA